MEDAIVITDSVVKKVHELILEENEPNLKLRIFVQGGGCSGFQYGFTFDEVANEDDWNPTIILEHGMKMLDFMEKRWSVNFEDWELNKKEVLGLGFMDIE